MYLAFARDFLLQGRWPDHDPYLYSLNHADLHIAHEYLSYLIFHGAWWLGGFGGLIALKMLVLAAMFFVALRSEPREQSNSLLWIMMWCLAVLAASFRFIARSSLFSDLFCVLLVQWLLVESRLTRSLLIRLTILFLLWVQLHPGYPLGLALLAIWTAWHLLQDTPGFRSRALLGLGLPVAVLLLNPLGLEGLLYPFRFALNEAQVLKRHNFEWFPSYSQAFRFTPEVLAFWTLCLTSLFVIARERAWRSLGTWFAVFAMILGATAVRFVPWVSFALLVALKPFAHTTSRRLTLRGSLRYAVALFLAAVAVKNLTLGYLSSSGPRRPQLALDSQHFPSTTLDVLKAHPIPGRLYNVHDYGSSLIWAGYTPVFHHGFVTDMDFYEHDVVGVFESQQRFLELAKKYNWTMLLVDKTGAYHYFYKILSPLPNWKIVAEDDASYLIYDLGTPHP